MTILAENLGKRYQKYWIFKGLTAAFSPGRPAALLGSNGSGKSTLLRMLAGMQAPTEGTLIYQKLPHTAPLNPTSLYRHVSYCAPGLELPEELNMEEFFQFHFTFKAPPQGMSLADVMQTSGLPPSAYQKPITEFSSGMKQRIKLLQAFCTDSSVLLLDEPCTNLDDDGVAQYKTWLETYASRKTVIIASNDLREYETCQQQLRLSNYQKA